MYVISGNFDLQVWVFGCYCIFPPSPINLLLHFEFELAVEFSKEFIEICPSKLRTMLTQSCRFGFGLKYVSGYSTWQKEKKIPESLAISAAQIIVFDQIIINSDRIPNNPNCQFNEDDLLIYDHELAFTTTLFWIAPWEKDGMKDLANRDRHIFAGPYFEVAPSNLDDFLKAWKQIKKIRFQQYKNALPKEWVYDEVKINSILKHLSDVHDNIDSIVEQSIRVLAS